MVALYPTPYTYLKFSVNSKLKTINPQTSLYPETHSHLKFQISNIKPLPSAGQHISYMQGLHVQSFVFYNTVEMHQAAHIG